MYKFIAASYDDNIWLFLVLDSEDDQEEEEEEEEFYEEEPEFDRDMLLEKYHVSLQICQIHIGRRKIQLEIFNMALIKLIHQLVRKYVYEAPMVRIV